MHINALYKATCILDRTGMKTILSNAWMLNSKPKCFGYFGDHFDDFWSMFAPKPDMSLFKRYNVELLVFLVVLKTEPFLLEFRQFHRSMFYVQCPVLFLSLGDGTLFVINELFSCQCVRCIDNMPCNVCIPTLPTLPTYNVLYES